ncbi:response regulator [Deferribacteres bacterium DY0609]|uniref:response regulator n=1 Tax=Denitrovibrio acetiphilus TaxID=118000 RepID=UPI00019B46EA|nr:response regulator [Denitrovibrio acetiphilus]
MLTYFSVLLIDLSKKTKAAEIRNNLSNELSMQMNDLVILIYEIVLFDSKQAKTKWLDKYAQTTQTVEKLTESPAPKLLARKMHIKMLHELLKNVFTEYLKIANKTGNDNYYKYQIDIQTSNIFSISSELNKNVLVLQKQTVTELSNLTQKVNKEVLMFIFSLTIFLIMAFIFLWKRVIRPIVFISKILPEYAIGSDLEPLKWKYNDEIGIFVNTFNDTLEKRNEWENELTLINRQLLNTNKDLAKARDAAEQASKAKSSFLANMSHEIRTPLNGIIGLTKLMLDLELSNKQKDYMRKIDRSAKALLGILNDVLDLSKIEAGKLRIDNHDFVFESVFKSIDDLFTIKIEEKGLELFFEIDPEIPQHLTGDPLRIKQVLINLVSNAVKFTDEGEIHIKAEVTEITDSDISILFSVRDTGVGIPANELEKIFTAFTQVDETSTRRYEGTGLGLAITKNLVSMMGGTVTVESDINMGSIFSFKLTLQIPVNAVSSNPNNLYGMKTLVVDDKETSREILRKILESWSFEVYTAKDGESALKLAQAEHEKGSPFHLVLVDWKMPGMDGFETAEKIREFSRDSGIHDKIIMIMVTAYEKELTEKMSGNDNFNFVLSKPVTPSILFDSIVNIQYPKNSAEAETYNEVAKAYPGNDIGGKSVLLVEDNSVNRLVAQETLQKFGLTVEVALNGKDAVEKVKSKKYDAVLMDIHMPVMDGYRATAEIRQIFDKKQLPIIALTADALDTHKEKCFAVGMNDHLSKPINIEILFKVLCKWLQVDYEIQEMRPSDEYFQQLTKNKITCLDIESAGKRINYDWELLRAAIATFRNDYKDAATTLNKLMENKQFEQAEIFLHELKGAAGYIGAVTIVKMAIDLRQALLDEKLDSTTLLTQELCSELDNVIININNIDADTYQSSNNIQCSDQRIKQVFSTVLDIISNFKLVPDETMTELSSVLQSYPIIFEKLESEINDFDYSKAEVTLKKATLQLGIDMEESDD